MLAVALALASSLSWGLADFLGGLQSRRQALVAVLWVSQGSALLVLLAVVASGVPSEHDAAATAWGAAAGLVGLCGLAAFYRALSIGTMSIVAPLSATGTVIPVLAGLAAGDRPSVLQAAGMALAAFGVVLAAREAPGEDAAARRATRRSIVLALAAAVGFGSFLTMLDRAEETADVAWVLLAARVPDVAVLTLVVLVRRPALPADRTAVAALLAVGGFDLLANLMFAVAAGEGLLSVVGVLGSLYPAVTVVLARMLLHERPTVVQDAGVVVTLAGVVAIAAG
jgi:drug/metabolite transporter (DMT)-like permease